MLQTSNLGYPRIGQEREWKRALESYWQGDITEEILNEKMKQIRLSHLQKQLDSGIDLIPVGDFSYYDHVLDTAMMFGVIPDRFKSKQNDTLETFFSMARGSEAGQASEMTKWFDTNYHYIVPEFEASWTPQVKENTILKAYKEAKKELGIDGKPVILGPFTFLKLSKGYEPKEFSTLLDKLTPLYEQIIKELHDEGASLIQLDEPSLVTSLSQEDINQFKELYKKLTKAVPEANIFLQTYFDSVDYYSEIVSLPVKGLGLDFKHDKGKNLQYIKELGFPNDKILGVGLIDGRNIWKADLMKSVQLLEELKGLVSSERLLIQTSSSLLHVPVSLNQEVKLTKELKDGLAFADEKLVELKLLGDHFRSGSKEYSQDFQNHQKQVEEFNQSPFRKDIEAQTLAGIKTERELSFEKRKGLQEKKWNLPFLPTTTIGSFPQTKDMRQARTKWRKGELDDLKYESLINEKIEKWIDIQEKVGLDVFVHGEFERNDMVEYFGEKLEGFAVTKNGWVQSYGSRCVKPPVIYGNVNFDQPMTVKETAYAQTLTKKPVKGMLTGPVTILNWSFVRDDISNKEVTRQIAKALVEEIEALENAGIEMIQVDEPALREGLPLKAEDQQEYLSWAVESFRIATAHVLPTSQIHTHMCYCEFHDIIDSINALDADVISIETSRSHGELIQIFKTNVYEKGIGLGVYDIHSPRIPEINDMVQVIEKALEVLPAKSFWVNPDCGLKTRTEDQTIAALENMVEATKKARSLISAK
ncbi:5-methyltetrahydropteroyltriglutamate--homocysteine S-methyltransferase [Salipaludibacillus sp. CF4.18]|uniref:5-methyltetrahydropteroyltriglutamate-- homocysteine S-methyltransferase n=1 Tax=Salipaludibacillus sp. CF4.18 TaxID=3373081 RepID=UPI003EE4E1D2